MLILFHTEIENERLIVEASVAETCNGQPYAEIANIRYSDMKSVPDEIYHRVLSVAKSNLIEQAINEFNR